MRSCPVRAGRASEPAGGSSRLGSSSGPFRELSRRPQWDMREPWPKDDEVRHLRANVHRCPNARPVAGAAVPRVWRATAAAAGERFGNNPPAVVPSIVTVRYEFAPDRHSEAAHADSTVTIRYGPDGGAVPAGCGQRRRRRLATGRHPTAGKGTVRGGRRRRPRPRSIDGDAPVGDATSAAASPGLRRHRRRLSHGRLVADPPRHGRQHVELPLLGGVAGLRGGRRHRVVADGPRHAGGHRSPQGASRQGPGGQRRGGGPDAAAIGAGHHGRYLGCR